MGMSTSKVGELTMIGSHQSLKQDYKHCLEIMQAASKNYSFASRFLPAEKLSHVSALYAFLRVGDDRVDVSHHGFNSSLEAIEHWEQNYWHAFNTGSSLDPVLRAYLDTAQKFSIPSALMDPYFKAMKADLSITRFQTFSDLVNYMKGSAITVGQAMTYILGIQPGYVMEEVLPYADALSIAMQLSNFWRDIRYDWSIGRVYIPQEDLQRFGVTEDDIANQRLTSQFIDLLSFEIDRTEQYYQQARLDIPKLASGQWGVHSSLEIYRSIITNIKRNGYDVYNHHNGANKFGKIGLALKSWWCTRNY